MHAPAPVELRYRREHRELLVRYEDGEFALGAEFLRVNSPSAEVQGHGGEGGTLPRHKEDVTVTAIEPVGNYAVKIRFSDGHDSGLYSWDWLRTLCLEMERLWREYRDKLAATPDPAAGEGESQSEGVVRFVPGPRPAK
jgi:DUF971 family protein